MQEQPHMNPPMQPFNVASSPRRQFTGIGCLNVITIVGISLFIFLEIIGTFTTGYENHIDMSPAIAWDRLTEGFKTGLLYIDQFGTLMVAAIFGLPLVGWGLLVFLGALLTKRKEPAEKKVFVWASILLGVLLGLFMCIAAFVAVPGCVPVDINPYHEADPGCRLPIRPGVVAPPPTYYSPDGLPIKGK